MTEPEAATLVGGLAAIASIFLRDEYADRVRLADDPDDDYLAHAALDTGSLLVTRDEAAHFERIEGLRVARLGAALRLVGGLDDEDP